MHVRECTRVLALAVPCLWNGSSYKSLLDCHFWQRRTNSCLSREQNKLLKPLSFTAPKNLWIKAIVDHKTSFFLMWVKESCLLFHVFVIKTTSQRVRINIYTVFVLGSIHFNPLTFPSSVHSSSLTFLSTNTSGNGSKYSFANFTELPSRQWFQEIQFEKKDKDKRVDCRIDYYPLNDGFGGLVVSILATGTRVRGFKPRRSRWIFRASGKSSVCLPSEGK